MKMENKRKRTPLQILYILQNKGTNEYKIGITNDLNRRLKELQTGCPNELIIIKIYTHYQRKFTERYERILHDYYTEQGCRIREDGEWFRLDKSDIALLTQPNGIKEQNALINRLLEQM